MEKKNNSNSEKSGGAGKFVLGAAVGAVVGAVAGKFAHDKYAENKDDIDAKLGAAKDKVIDTKDKVVNKAEQVGRSAKNKAQRGALKVTRGAKKGLDKVEQKIKNV